MPYFGERSAWSTDGPRTALSRSVSTQATSWSSWTRMASRMIGLERLIGRVVELGNVMGYGTAGVTDFSWKRNYLHAKVWCPYSMPLFCGDIKGSTEAFPVSYTHLRAHETRHDLVC